MKITVFEWESVAGEDFSQSLFTPYGEVRFFGKVPAFYSFFAKSLSVTPDFFCNCTKCSCFFPFAMVEYY